MVPGASGSVSDGKSERERQEGVGSMTLPTPWRPDGERVRPVSLKVAPGASLESPVLLK